MGKGKQTNQPSLTDLAKLLGLSVSGVSRALNNDPRISQATKKRVQALAQQLNYQPNHLAAGLRRGKSKLLGVIVPFIDGRFFAVVIKGIELAASRAGFSVIICQSNEDVAHERQNIETLLSAQVEGILVSISRTTHDFAHFEKVQQRGIPLVFFDRILVGTRVNAVVLDDYAGGFLATQHLIEQGCQRIGHFAGPQQLGIYAHRRQGYLDALRKHGLPLAEEFIVYCDPIALDTGKQAMQKLLQLPERPDAIFSASDAAAVGALQLLEEQQLRVPQDVALVGFSNEMFTSLTKPLITSVDQCCEQMGQAAVRLFLQLGQEPKSQAPQHVVLQPELCIRASSLRNT
ncbi:LacI family DNA-binding transcriptional regulator [Hymenobacter volaticus]|uniref:LacI family transcriptional regulator n=1 Tax=Hymenobacter volaticus TaxID=2932254 RepID=A0ABY4GDI9_9BACT|nr:LacI family DNA-binding transcriptional regulator [Hymenobacter volaticus]UOQ68827.1 LacI family transcriptional regulator [Hymenobacter volaticus]